MTTIPFYKMNGLGNDFVIIDERVCDYKVDSVIAKKMADRESGIGCDQLVVLRPSKIADCRVIFYNSDGSMSAACGNATRCIGSILMNERKSSRANIETDAGILQCMDAGEKGVAVNMGQAKTYWEDIPLEKPADTMSLPIGEGVLQNPVAVSMGNPHAVFFVDDVDAVDLDKLGPILEHHEIFPERANIGVAQVLSDHEIKLRVWERGACETQSCGTGACAAAVAAKLKGFVYKDVKVIWPRGILYIHIADNMNVTMTGAAEFEFAGDWEVK